MPLLVSSAFALLLNSVQSLSQQQPFEFKGFPKDVRKNIGKKFAFLKETKWHWNGWNDVVCDALHQALTHIHSTISFRFLKRAAVSLPLPLTVRVVHAGICSVFISQ
jgi:hypothetical protein